MYAGHLDLNHPLYWVCDDALDAEACASFIARMDQESAQTAPIIGRAGLEIDEEVRNNTRVMFDDQALADSLLSRVKVPERLMKMRLVGANERIRLYRYTAGQHHGVHWDTPVERSAHEYTLLTFVIYLNEGFEGGGTYFPELDQRIVPKVGRALLFQHRVLHEAEDVSSGEKYVLRTDVFYRTESP